MGIFELFVLAVGLSMDAFAVSICKGLSLGEINKKHMCIAGAWFGGFQALMPFIGYLLGSIFADKITKYDHWIAFVLLGFIGGNMVREAGEMQATIDVGEYGTGFDIVDAVTDFCIKGKEVEKVINRPSKVYDKTNLSELDRVIFE